MTSPTIRIQDANLSKIVFGKKQPPLDPKIGLENVFISYENDKQWPRFQFPILEHRFDSFETYEGKRIGRNEAFDMTLTFDPNNPRHQKVMEKLGEFDDQVLKMVQDNPAWLETPLTDEHNKSFFLKKFWFPSLKVKKVEKGGSTNEYFTMKFRIPKRGDKLATQAQDMDTGEDIDIYDNLKPKCNVLVIGRPARIYVQKKEKVGIVWEATIMRIKGSETANGGGDLFLKDEDDEATGGVGTIEDDIAAVDDSDDAEEVIEEPEEKTKPAVKGRGKKGTK